MSDSSVAVTASTVLVVARSRPRAHALLQEFCQTRLDDRTAAFVDRQDLLYVEVDADDVMAVGGE
jgi:hypothetical protein